MRKTYKEETKEKNPKHGNDHTSKVAFDTFGDKEDFVPKGNQSDPIYCKKCKCFGCDCEKKEESFTRSQFIGRMVEASINKKIINLTLKEMESEALEAKEERLGKDLDGDGEKGESPAHKAKVLGKKKESSNVPGQDYERYEIFLEIFTACNSYEEFHSMSISEGIPDPGEFLFRGARELSDQEWGGRPD